MTKNKKAVAAVAALVIAAIWAAPDYSDQESGEARAYAAPAPRAEAISEDVMRMASDTIALELDVVDASISQQGEKLALAIIVRNGTSEGRAKQLGDNFVRMAKTFGPDDNPSKEIGRGRYDYRIGVKTLDGRTLAMGAKIGPASHITW